MSPQTHAQQLLASLYRRLIRRIRNGATAHGDWDLELLPQRMLFTVTPVGTETLVNPTTTGTQSNADVAVSSGGTVAFTWQSSTSTATNPAVAIRSDGQYLAVWAVSTDIHAQFYDSTGTALGSEFVANNSTAGTQADPDVAMDANGDFVITWDGQGAGDTNGVWARRFAPDGTPVAGQFRVNASTANAQHDPAVAMADDGSFLIGFTDDTSGGRNAGQYFDSTGTGQGEFTISSNKLGNVAVAANSTGNFAVAWTEKISGKMTALYRRYTGGSAVDGAGVVVDSSGLDQADPAIAIDSNGNFIVAWDEQGRDGSGLGVYGRHVLANGTFDGASFRINTTTSGDQARPAISMTPGGIAIAVWDGNGPGDTNGIFRQQLNAIVAANQAPVNTVPGAQTTLEDTSLAFSSGNSNAISIADADAGLQPVRVTLTVTSGSLTLASLAGLTFIGGDGLADGTMTFSGTITAINAALNGMTFTPAADMNGSATLSITTNDLGNTGSGGALADTDSVTINVTAVNDAPVNSLPPSQTVSGGGVLNLGGLGASISVSDVDAGSSPLDVTLTASTGSLTLGSTAGLTFISGSGSSDSSMEFRGTLSAINNALNGMQYNAPLILLGNAYITITTNDLGNTGAGGALSDTDTLTLGSAPTNNPPVLTLPGTQTLAEDANLIFSSANGNGLSVDDPDAGSGAMQVTLSSTHGALTLSKTTGLTFSTGDGTQDASMVFTGTLADINNALEGAVFTPTGNYNGSAAISVIVNDQGNSGAGGAQQDSGSVALSISAVNDAPVIASQNTNVSVNEDTPLVFSSGNGNLISISDVDAGSGALRVNLVVANGTLSLSGTSGLSFSTGDGTGDASMTFTGTLSAINAALAGMTFTPNANFSGGAGIAIDVNDQGNAGSGGAQTDSNVEHITVNGVNDPPVNSVPGAQSVNEDGTLTFSGGNAITISDIDAGGNSIVQVTLSATNGAMTLLSTTGLTFSVGDGSNDGSMVFTGTIGDINAALDGLAFKPTADFNGSASVGIVTNDQGNSGSGGAQSDSDSVAVTVNPVNDAPINSVPTTQTTSEDTPLVFSTGNGNAISISDIDAGSGAVKVTLTSTHGTLTLASLSNLTFTVGDGTADTTMTFTGTMTAINAALNDLSFNPAANYNGNANVSITTNDQGNTGSGGALSDTDSVDVTISAVNDAPTISVPGAQSILVGSSITFSASNDNANGITLGDIDAGSSQVKLTLSASIGALTLSRTNGLTFITGDGTDDASMTFTGTLSAINAALNGLQYTPPANATGIATVSLNADDQGNTGSGGALTASASVSVEMVHEFRVNTSIDNTQHNASVAMAADGRYVVVWSSNHTGQSFYGYGIYLQRYDAAGHSMGSQYHVNITTPGDQTTPVIAMDTAGNYVVAWMSDTGSGNGAEIIARKFDGNGNPLTGEIAVNQTSAGDQIEPAIAMSAGGGFVIAWTSQASVNRSDIYARVFDASGAASGSEFRVNTDQTNSSSQPSVAIDAGRRFVIAWKTTQTNGTPVGIFARRYNPAGNAQGSDFQVNTTTGGVENHPAVALLPAHDFVIAWEAGGNQDGDQSGIYARQFDSSGSPITGEVLVNTTTSGSQTAPAVAADTSGRFVISWTSEGQDGSGKGIYGQSFLSLTTPTGNEFHVSGTTLGDQDASAVAMNAGSSLVVVWNGAGMGDADGVFGQLYRTNLVLPGTQVTGEDTMLVFSNANVNAPHVTSMSDALGISLTATNGLLTLGTMTGLTFTTGDGIADGTLVFTGSDADVNAALASLSFTPNANYNGTASIAVIAQDAGSPSTTATGSIPIIVNPTNDAPTATPIPDVHVNEDAPDTHIVLQSHFADLEDAASALAYSVASFTNPSLYNSVSIDSSTGDLILRYAPNANGAGAITIRATDTGGLFVDVTFNVNVAPVNDAPTLTADTGTTVDAQSNVVIASTMLQLSDIDNSASQLTFTLTAVPDSGFVSLAGNPLSVGSTFTQADLNAGRVTYSEQINSANDHFSFTAADGSGGTVAVSDFAITIKPATTSVTPPPPSAPPPAPAPENTPTIETPSTTSSGSGGTGGTSQTAIDRVVDAATPASAQSNNSAPASAKTSSRANTGTSSSGSSTPAANNQAAVVQANPAQVERPAEKQNEVQAAKPAAPVIAQRDLAPVVAPPPTPAPIAPAAAATPVLPPPPPAQQVNFIAQIASDAPSKMSKALDNMVNEVKQQDQKISLVAGSASFVSLGLSIVYILWTIRAGYLLASLLSTMPAWSFVDPLPILDNFKDPDGERREGEDGESLQSMVTGEQS